MIAGTMFKELTNEQVRERIAELWNAHAPSCHREDEVEAMWTWIEESDFFVAPASARFHNSCEGGLARHTLNVATLAGRLAGEYLESHPEVEDERLVDKAVTCGILHDLCKVGLYSINDGTDEERPVDEWPYVYDKEQVRRHGTLSRKIVHEYMPHIDTAELDAIEWHMGAYDRRFVVPDHTKTTTSALVRGLDKLKQAKEKQRAARRRTPLVDIVHLADTISANIWE